MEDAQSPAVERSIEVGADPAAVWERLVEGRLSVEWLGVVLEPRLGGRVSSPGDDLFGVVEAVDPGRSITWTWRRRDGDPSQVVVQIEPFGAGTRVTVTERMLGYEISAYPPIVVSAA